MSSNCADITPRNFFRPRILHLHLFQTVTRNVIRFCLPTGIYCTTSHEHELLSKMSSAALTHMINYKIIDENDFRQYSVLESVHFKRRTYNQVTPITGHKHTYWPVESICTKIQNDLSKLMAAPKDFPTTHCQEPLSFGPRSSSWRSIVSFIARARSFCSSPSLIQPKMTDKIQSSIDYCRTSNQGFFVFLRYRGE